MHTPLGKTIRQRLDILRSGTKQPPESETVTCPGTVTGVGTTVIHVPTTTNNNNTTTTTIHHTRKSRANDAMSEAVLRGKMEVTVVEMVLAESSGVCSNVRRWQRLECNELNDEQREKVRSEIVGLGREEEG